MLNDLTLLIRLQKIDEQLMDIESDKGDLPEQLKLLKIDLDKARVKLQQVNQEIESIEVQKKQQQRTIQEADDRLKKSHSVLYSVKTTREYDAISSEMDQAKNQIADCERKNSDLTKKEDQLLELQLKWQEIISVVEAEYDDKKLEMDERLGKTHDEELQLAQQRLDIVKDIKAPIYSHYNRIRSIRDGIGIAGVDGSACGYCFSIVPPQRIAEILKMNDMILCEVCGCILVDDELMEDDF